MVTTLLSSSLALWDTRPVILSSTVYTSICPSGTFDTLKELSLSSFYILAIIRVLFQEVYIVSKVKESAAKGLKNRYFFGIIS